MSGWGMAIGAGLSLADSALNRQGKKNAEKRQLKNSKELSEFNRKQNMKFWEDTNYPAQVKKMKEAGLNVGLMTSQGAGGAGSTQSGTTNAPMSEAEDYNLSQGMGLAIDKMLTKAQIENVKADTHKKEVEANKLETTDTEESQARTQSLLQGIENQKSQKELTDIQTKIANVQNVEQWMTQEDRIDKIKWESRLIANQARSALAQANVDEKTWETKTKIIAEELTYNTLRNALTGTQINKTSAEIRQISQDIVNSIQDTHSRKVVAGAQRDNARTNEDRATEEMRNNRISEALGKAGIDQANKQMWMNLLTTIINGVVSRGNTIISNR